MDGGSQEGLAPFAKYNEKSFSGRCILLQPCRREGLWGKEIRYRGDGRTYRGEKEKMKREYSKTYAKKIYYIRKK